MREEEKAIEIKKKEVRAKAEVEYNKWVKQYKAKKKLQEDAVCFVCYLCYLSFLSLFDVFFNLIYGCLSRKSIKYKVNGTLYSYALSAL